jgi:hypothetical protein
VVPGWAHRPAQVLTEGAGPMLVGRDLVARACLLRRPELALQGATVGALRREPMGDQHGHKI